MVDNKCEANCPAKATNTLIINGVPWRFCDHHTNEFKHLGDKVSV